MKRFLLLLAFVAALTATSCRKMVDKARENIRLEAIEKIQLRGLTSIEGVVRVKNDTGYKLSLESANVTVYYADEIVARAILEEGVELDGHTTASLPTLWRLKIHNPLTLYAAARKAMAGDISQMAVSGQVEGRGGPVPVKISREKMPLSEFLNIFGLSIEDIKSSFTL